MKLVAKLTLVALVVLLATASFAADASTTTKLSLQLNQPTTIAGVKLQAGNYKVIVDRTGETAKVRVTTNGDKEVVSTTAKFKTVANLRDEARLSLDSSRNLTALDSNKLNGTLVFEGSTAVDNGGK